MNQSNPPAAAGPLTIQETLRTIGLGLEVARVRRVDITITADGVDLDSPSEYGHRTYSWADVESQSRAQQKHRRPQARPAPWMDPAALGRWSVLLRVVGQLLDAQGIRACRISASLGSPNAPQDCQIAVTVDGRVVVDEEQVQLQLLRLRTRYVDARASSPEPSRRPWWAVWKRD